jgi:hypothetical protein
MGEAGALFMQGWEREVKLTGFWGKMMKQTINTRLIYPWRGRLPYGVTERHSPG